MKIFKIISLTSYCFIFLMGMMIPLPFLIWLIVTLFSFGNIDQVFAILGIAGIILNLVKWKDSYGKSIISFILMISPIISRLIQVSFEKFHYLGFEIPLVIFIVTYIIFIVLQIKIRRAGNIL
ncbi:hypothetical protein [Chryseobacterium sp. FH2]|uniref:hypothetical protein n=1 Tax=Chryseobacterium sp. FH2 TaxID=1674291 RepID=UPI001E37D2A3|nr:hypothetical protein [Chryseobacterium sp. FH2]